MSLLTLIVRAIQSRDPGFRAGYACCEVLRRQMGIDCELSYVIPRDGTVALTVLDDSPVERQLKEIQMRLHHEVGYGRHDRGLPFVLVYDVF